MLPGDPKPDWVVRLELYLRDLCLADWNDANCPMRLSSTLSAADLLHAPFFQNTRLLLVALQEQQGAPATATGKLTRDFVRLMLDRIVLSPKSRESILEFNKVINEQDVWDLHLVRIVGEIAGLLKRRGKRFTLTRSGARLLDDECAGEIYRLLFLTYFSKFDLGYDFFLRDIPAIQQSIATVFWRLNDVAQDWAPVQDTAPLILMPRVYQLMKERMNPHDTEEWVLAGYVLDPLHDFGLLERRRKGTDRWTGIYKKDFVRVTPLWRKFISFKQFLPIS